MVDTLDQNFWNSRWENAETGWDLGAPSPALMEYFAQVKNKTAKILIPGCGNAHEADFLLKTGFKNITILDIAPKAVDVLRKKFKNNPEISVICDDFFDHQEKYNIIIEQTFFCAISPFLREDYVKKVFDLLQKNGRLIGVLFDKVFEKPEPPFGGNTEEYRSLFKNYFEIKTMEPCYNSIQSRRGTEVFINLIKKNND